jgi:hypothetical protein
VEAVADAAGGTLTVASPQATRTRATPRAKGQVRMRARYRPSTAALLRYAPSGKPRKYATLAFRGPNPPLPERCRQS